MNARIERWCRATARVALIIAGVVTTAIGSSACSSTDDAAHGESAAGRAAKSAEVPSEAAEKEEHEGGSTGRVVLTRPAAATANILVEPVRLDATTAVGGGIEVPGQVDLDPARVALVSPRTAGRIERLLVVTGQRVAAGQTVALLYSPAFVTAQSDLLQAKRRSEVLEGTADAAGTRALLAAARRRLELLGVSEAMIRRIEADGEPQSLLTVVAPFSGSILEAHALAGAAVEAGTPLFKIADLSVVNVAAAVPERAAFAVRAGQPAVIRVAGVPDRSFAGRVTRVADQINTTTRTVDAFLEVPNTRGSLKPGMSATVLLRTGAQGATRTLTVPASAVITDGAERFVFVEVAERTYERREVELADAAARGMGPQTGTGRVVVVSGLSPGDRVVVRGAFTLKSELAKAAFADDDH